MRIVKRTVNWKYNVQEVCSLRHDALVYIKYEENNFRVFFLAVKKIIILGCQAMVSSAKSCASHFSLTVEAIFIGGVSSVLSTVVNRRWKNHNY